MQVNIDRISYPGTSVSAKTGKIILCDCGLPGETVRLCRLKEKKNYILAETCEIIKASPFRVEPRCAHYRICGPYQYIDYSLQCRIKQDQLKEMSLRLAGKNFKPAEFRPSPLAWDYRNKIHLHLIRQKNRLSYAYHLRKQQKKFEPLQECFLVSRGINAFLRALLEKLDSDKIFFVKEVIVRENYDKKILAGLICEKNYSKNRLKKILSGLTESFPLQGLVAGDKTNGRESIIFGEPLLKEQILGSSFFLGINSFFQINRSAFENLLSDLISILDLKGSETLLDLYCGVGTIGMILAPLTARVLSLESNRENFELIGRNSGINRIKNISLYPGKSEDLAETLLAQNPDLVIMDPPRKGLDKKLISALNAFLPPRLAYISCDPATLFRDLKKLLPGYDLAHFRGYDFFPQTPHIECLAVLEKKC